MSDSVWRCCVDEITVGLFCQEGRRARLRLRQEDVEVLARPLTHEEREHRLVGVRDGSRRDAPEANEEAQPIQGHTYNAERHKPHGRVPGVEALSAILAC